MVDDRVQEITNLEIEKTEKNVFKVKVEVLSNLSEIVSVEKVVSINE